MAYCHDDRRLCGLHDRNTDSFFQGCSKSGHPGAPHHENVGSMGNLQRAANLDHAVRRPVFVGQFCDT
jgi:hypothetical protein